MTSPRAAERVCDWCKQPLAVDARRLRSDARFCSRKCRQAAWRLRGRSEIGRPHQVDGPGLAAGATFAICDPPYIGLAKRYYGDQPEYAGEVDHVELIANLEERRLAQTETVLFPGGPERRLAGWALACSEASLVELLPLVPRYPVTRIGIWGKPHGASPQTYGPHGVWEAVLVVGGRRRRPGVPNMLVAFPARGGGKLPGRKPIAWCAWVFDLLGMLPGDQLEDLFPGTGIVTAAWGELSRRPAPAPSDVSPGDG